MAEMTGRKVLAITVGAFGVIIAVNVVMAWKAISTFPGLEVRDSYVASQTFDAERRAQDGLGWTLTPSYAGGKLHLAIQDRAGAVPAVATLDVLIGRPTEASDDRRPAFGRVADGYMATVDLGRGKWMLHVTARAEDGTLFRQRLDLVVPG